MGPSLFEGRTVKYTDLKLYDFSRFDGNLEDFDSKGRRPSGLHVSGLVRAAYKNLKGTESKAIEGEQPFVRAAAGFMWERALEYAFTEYMQKDRRIEVDKQGGVSKEIPDGRMVTGTPDGVNGEYIEEYKCTWRSMRKWSEDPEAEFWMWLAQVKAYCFMTGRCKARFFIFWVNGDYSYKTGRGPQVTTCEMEFTEDELVDNWQILLAHADQAKEEKH